MLVNFLHQPWNSVSIHPEGPCMPLGTDDGKMRACGNPGVNSSFLSLEYDASVESSLGKIFRFMIHSVKLVE